MIVDDFLDRLEGVRRTSNGAEARCPAHEDRRQSLSVTEGDGGKILVKCHAGCTVEAVVEVMGISMKDLFPAKLSPFATRPRKVKKVKPASPPLSDEEVARMAAALEADADAWAHVTEKLQLAPEVVRQARLGLYLNGDGRRLAYPYLYAGRFTFANARALDGQEAKFQRTPIGQPTTLYRGDTLEPGGVVIVTEGEKDALAALTMGLGAELGGEGGASVVAIPGVDQVEKPWAVEPLRSQSRVYVALDADDKGDKAAAKLCAALGPKAVRLRPPAKDFGDVLAAHGPEKGLELILKAINEAPANGEPENKPDPPGLDLAARWVTFTAAELAIDPPEKAFLWAGRIPLGDVGVFAARGGAGKTALLTGLALHRAVGRPFLGRAVKPGTTTIVTAEDGREDYQRKIAAWRTWIPDLALEPNRAAVARHLHLVDVVGVPFKLIRSQFGEYVSTSHVEMLADVVKAKAPTTDLIVVETVSRVGGDESNGAMSALVCAAEELASLTRASVLLVAHVSQDAARRNIGDAYAPRGGTAIGANGRYTLTLTGVTDEAIAELLPGIALSPQQQKELSVFRVPKINAAPEPDPVILQIVPTRWGLILREYDAGNAQDPEERRRSARQSLGEALRAIAARMAGLGVPLTASRLSGGLWKEIPGLSRQRITAAVADAIEDGLLRQEKREGRGGGQSLLPGEKREGSRVG